MRRCPTQRELEDLLEERLGEEEREVLSGHVDSCDRCQAALEQLTEDGEVSAVASTPAPAAVDAQSIFLSRLKQLSPSDPSGSGPRLARVREVIARGVPGYEILGELGRGGMGVVYKARQVSLNRPVALKMILAGAHAAPKELTRFQQEAEAIARLRHPHIVQIYDIGESGGHPYCALEYVEEGSLAHRLRGDPQPLMPVARLVETLARTIHFAHQVGIVHRDLKPANILLQREEDQGLKNGKGPGSKRESAFLGSTASFLPKITDFGLAKRLDQNSLRTQTGEVLGTPSYMAPEQASAQAAPVGPATDVYALGAILYELLTGRPPFKGATSLDTVLQVLHQEPVRPSSLRPGLPRDLETVCLKCLEKEPHRRYRTALELAEDLRRFQTGAPVLARPTPAWERCWKWARQRPSVAGLLVGIILVTILGFAGMFRLWKVASQERDEKWQQLKAAHSARSEEEKQRNRAQNALYLSLISQSQLQYRVNDFTNAVHTLNRCRPQPEDLDQKDRRGWEWYYLRGLFHSDLWSWQHAHPGSGGSAAYSADGRWIASVVGGYTVESPDQPGEVRVWDTTTGKAVLVSALPGTAHRLVFTPDSKQLVLGTTDGWVLLRDVETGRKTWDNACHTQMIGGLAVTPSGQLVSASWDGTVKITDLQTGQCVHQLRGHGTQTPDDLLLVHPERVQCVAVHPRGHLIASGGWDASIKLWNAVTGKEVRTLLGHKAAVFSVSFSPDGRYLVSAANNGNLKVWEVATGRTVQNLTGHTGAVLGAVFSPDSRYLAYGGSDATVRIWEMESGVERVALRGHTAPVESVSFSPGGLRLISASPVQGAVKVWDLTRHPKYGTFARTGADVEALAFTAQGQRLVSFTVSGKLQAWDAKTGVLLDEKALPPLSPKGEAISKTMLSAFSPGGQLLAARSPADTRQVKLWKVADGTEEGVLKGHKLPVSCLRFSGDGRLLATAGSEPKGGREIMIWDVASGKQLAALEGRGRVFNLVFSPDGQRLAVGGEDGAVALVAWRAKREWVHTLGDKTEVTALAFSPDGRFLATGGLDSRKVIVWALEATAPVLRKLGPPLTAPTLLCDLAFTPDGRRLAGISRDLVKLWDMEERQEVLTLRGAPQRHWDPPFNPRIAFSPDGTRLAGTNWDESISLWDAVPEADTEAEQTPRIRTSDVHALFWHLQEAEHCLEHHNRAGARFHLQRFPNVPLPSPLRERTERLIARLKENPPTEQ